MAATTTAHTATTTAAARTGQAGPTGRPMKGVVRMSDATYVQVGSDELAALRARLAADAACPRCGQVADVWRRCRENDGQ